mgnify:CR=1 FL=1
MCGISGIFCLGSNKIKKDELIKFNNSLSHRGPEQSKTFINQQQTLGFGHRMLSIFGTTEESSQPMVYNHYQKEIFITFNGAIYNFIELRNELKSLGYKFRSNSDTEVILASYLKWGEKCEKKFNGIWSYAIWDNDNNKLILSRDRFGVKPIYYLKHESIIYFASEIKAFLFINPQFKPKINYSHLMYMGQNWYNNSYINNKNTLLKNVKELQPGHKLEISSKSKLNIIKWWSTIDEIKIVPKNKDEQVFQFKELFINACKLRMRSDVKVAATLSGGIDSSSIVASIDNLYKEKLIDNKLETFLLKYSNDKLSDFESKYALEVSKNLSFKNNIFILDDKLDYTDDLIKIIYHKEDVDGDDGLGPWNLYKFIKQNNFKVVLEGHGSDELLAGYNGYIINALDECRTIDQLSYKIDLLITDLKNKIPFSNFNLLRQTISKFLHNKFNWMIGKEQKINFLTNEEMILNETNIEESKFLKPLNKELYIDFHYKALQTNLRRFDRLSMAHGLESRSPFLDWRLVSYSFGLPASQKIKSGQNKKVLRDSMKNLVPRNILNRSFKTGFHMDNNSFNKITNDFIKETILSKDFQDISIFNKKKIHNFIISKDFNRANMKNFYKYIQIYYLNKKFS